MTRFSRLLFKRPEPLPWMVFLLALLLPACFACRADPERTVVMEVFGLIDEFYLTATDRGELLANTFIGMEKSLSKDVNASAEMEGVGEMPARDDDSQDAAPLPSPPPPTAPPEKETTEDPATEARAGPVMDHEAASLSPAVSANREMTQGPLQVSVEGEEITLLFAGDRLKLHLPSDRRAAVRAFLKGYRFVSRQAGGDENKTLFHAALRHMTTRLDPHSGFLPPVQYGKLKAETSGRFGGVGIEVGIRGDLLTVVAPIAGTPAAGAGLRPLDRIVQVDGKSTVGMGIYEAVSLIRGEVGTPVVLTIRRSGIDDFQVTLIRSIIPVNTIKAVMVGEGVAWVRLFSFNQSTDRDLSDALKALEGESGDIRGLILDLRSNPGGLLDQAVKVADQFLGSGLIVDTIGRGRLQEKERFAESQGTRGTVPIVVLVNHGSASGAEIVAGALQDHERALIVGTRTFGKGSVQSIFKLSQGAGLRLTTALYYTPNGRSIQVSGIVPDVSFRFPEIEEQIVSRHSESTLTGHIKSNSVTEDAPDWRADALAIRNHYLKTGAIVEDENYPEKGDWLLVFAQDIFLGGDVSLKGMLDQAGKLLARMDHSTSPAK